jgi:hypothetical protein
MTGRPTGDGPFSFESATVRFGDGAPFPVTGFTVDLAPSKESPHFLGGNLRFGFGFKADLGPELAEFMRVACEGATFDPDFDRRFAEWRCLGCGTGWDDVPTGHSWSLRGDGTWSCRGTIADGAANG